MIMLKLERNRKKKRKEYGKASLSRGYIRLASNRRLCKLFHLYHLNISELTNAISEPVLTRGGSGNRVSFALGMAF
jgi:hypothetical protein